MNKKIDKKRNREKIHLGTVRSSGIYPETIKNGKFRRIKWIVTFGILFVYYLLPFLTYDRGNFKPDQMILVDMDRVIIYLAGMEISSDQFFLAALLLIASIYLMFIVANLYGRLWCGFTCPQTLWCDLFQFVEEKIEGSRSERIRLNNSAISIKKIYKKSVKHFAWILISIMTGGAWSLYFNESYKFLNDFINFELTNKQYAMVAIFSLTTYFFAGFLKSSFCKYGCPWGRFQSAMFNKNTYNVIYDKYRGEPRSIKQKKDKYTNTALNLELQKNEKNMGDCIDCDACVRVCPTGVDIRNGMQINCIGCSLCIDACNNMMDKMNFPRDLISFTTEHNLRIKNKIENKNLKKNKIISLKSIFFFTAFTVAAFFITTNILNRGYLKMTPLLSRTPLYVVLNDGYYQNTYNLKIKNELNISRDVKLSIEGLNDYSIFRSGMIDKKKELYFTLPPYKLSNIKVHLKSIIKKGESKNFKFTLEDINNYDGIKEKVDYNLIFQQGKH